MTHAHDEDENELAATPLAEAVLERVAEAINRARYDTDMWRERGPVEVASENRGALAAQPVPVAVKGLEWISDATGMAEDCSAMSICGLYSAGKINGEYAIILRHASEGGSSDTTVGWAMRSIDAAKAAAQADYESRIRSALAPAQAAPGDMVERQAAIDAIDALKEQYMPGGGSDAKTILRRASAAIASLPASGRQG